MYLKGSDFYCALQQIIRKKTNDLPEFVQEQFVYRKERTLDYLMYLTLSGWFEDAVTESVLYNSPKFHEWKGYHGWRDHNEPTTDYCTPYDESEILYEASITVYRTTPRYDSSVRKVSDYMKKDANQVYLDGMRAVRICDLDFSMFRSVNMRKKYKDEIFWTPPGPCGIREGLRMPSDTFEIMEEISCSRTCKVIDSITWQRALKHMQLSPWSDSKRVARRGTRTEIEFYLEDEVGEDMEEDWLQDSSTERS
ncbi:hypothetical protein ASPTUDRAFT_31193 [Aspergillus tubingensis CBS 134.48]|uniref:Uncharacterized protein n=1 Tax=Aspergillus tubingensis (strain CBS 134.48) TaxID=767770 RepID=A0A1L9N1J8_ASPTC|nr:hypothetical protein ASPTUDRAFT_31193 [Aspergillus tubingensis CBS 134.48]